MLATNHFLANVYKRVSWIPFFCEFFSIFLSDIKYANANAINWIWIFKKMITEYLHF